MYTDTYIKTHICTQISVTSSKQKKVRQPVDINVGKHMYTHVRIYVHAHIHTHEHIYTHTYVQNMYIHLPVASSNKTKVGQPV